MTDLASDPEEFWERRHDLPVTTTTDDDVATRSADDHLVLLFDLPERVSEAFGPTVDRLSTFDCLAVAPPRYRHVTVTPVGHVSDETAALDTLVDDIGTTLAGVSSFEVEFPRLNLFPTVVYAEVEDGGRFAALNERVCTLDAIPVHDRDQQFVPHAAVGQFRDDDVAGLVEALEHDRALAVGPVTVDALDLVRVDLRDRFPQFERVERYLLA